MKQRTEEHKNRSHFTPAARDLQEKGRTTGAGLSSPTLQAVAAVIDRSLRIRGQQRTVQGVLSHPVQRQVEEEELIQGKFTTIQRQNLEEEEELLQGRWQERSTVQLRQNQPRENQTGLPDNLKQGVEQLSGLSLDQVRVHYNSPQPAQLNALAYAQGTDIHIGPGQEQHLPHEAWHVVQQAQDRVQPTLQLQDGIPVNDDQSLEREADEMGIKATLATN